jgi:hypothetical protein
VMRNLKGDSVRISKYVVSRCGDFTLDDERSAFIAAFLRAANPTPANVEQAPEPNARDFIADMVEANEVVGLRREVERLTAELAPAPVEQGVEGEMRCSHNSSEWQRGAASRNDEVRGLTEMIQRQDAELAALREREGELKEKARWYDEAVETLARLYFGNWCDIGNDCYAECVELARDMAFDFLQKVGRIANGGSPAQSREAEAVKRAEVAEAVIARGGE